MILRVYTVAGKSLPVQKSKDANINCLLFWSEKGLALNS